MTSGASSVPQGERNVLVTGGAGFIGSNLIARLIREPNVRVRMLDNLSRPRVGENVAWLKTLPQAHRIEFCEGDVRDARIVEVLMHGITDVFHLAAQVSVTGSLIEPRTDFDTNAMGTLHILEAARKSCLRPFVLFTSTNKVYGSLGRREIVTDALRNVWSDNRFDGVTEDEQLDFHSPYGCSKGAADQYVRDYARVFELPTVVFRMSCIAGPRQFGTEDQGWVAHFVFSILNRQPITIYGNGLQVRDVLHVDDLVGAMLATWLGAEHTCGQIYNIGGGSRRAVSLIEMISIISRQVGLEAKILHDAVRPGDQPLYISSTSKVTKDTGWIPRRSVDDIVRSLEVFWREHH